MHISCCKMVKAKEVDIFPLTKNSIKFINHISQLFENPIQIIIKKKNPNYLNLERSNIWVVEVIYWNIRLIFYLILILYDMSLTNKQKMKLESNLCIIQYFFLIQYNILLFNKFVHHPNSLLMDNMWFYYLVNTISELCLYSNLS
jgi:hypothetical protein